MTDLFLLSEAQNAPDRALFSAFAWDRAGGRPARRECDSVFKNGVRWRDAPQEYGPRKTIGSCMSASVTVLSSRTTLRVSTFS
jgi:transposase